MTTLAASSILTTRSSFPGVAAVSSLRGPPPTRRNTRTYFQDGPLSLNAVTDSPEQRAIISGIGISRIGRKTGIPGLELTVEAAREAIADAGLEPADIDGVTTMGDTPPGDAAAALGIDSTYHGGGFTSAGLLSPVTSAAIAVAEGRARHV